MFGWTKPFLHSSPPIPPPSKRALPPPPESITLQVLLENPLDVPLVLTELFLLWKFHPHSVGAPEGGSGGSGGASEGPSGASSEASRVITNETEREHLLAAKEVVTTEVLSDFYLLPCERKPVELSVAPKTVGKLAITGLAFSLGASAPSQHSQSGHHLSSATSSSTASSSFLGAASETLGDVESVRVKGKVCLTVRGNRLLANGPPVYARDHRLELRVVESMPLLRVAFSEFPEHLLCGEVRLISMQISNVGQQPLTRLRLTTNLAGILTFGFDEYVHMLNSDVYQTLTASVSSCALRPCRLLSLSPTLTLSPLSAGGSWRPLRHLVRSPQRQRLHRSAAGLARGPRARRLGVTAVLAPGP